MNSDLFCSPVSENLFHDQSALCGSADAVCFAASTKQAQQAVQYAYANRIPLTVQGARTGLHAGAVPNGGILLSTLKLNKFLSFRMDSARVPVY
jgi:D-lactate dehydrogenase (cytochrome)